MHEPADDTRLKAASMKEGNAFPTTCPCALEAKHKMHQEMLMCLDIKVD